MIEIKGTRGSGKTTALLYLAHGSGAVVIEPNWKMADFVKKEAAKLKLDGVEIISMHELLDPIASSRYRGKKFLIDELDMFLNNLNVKGYSKTDDD